MSLITHAEPDQGFESNESTQIPPTNHRTHHHTTKRPRRRDKAAKEKKRKKGKQKSRRKIGRGEPGKAQYVLL